jgi:hypothetical protein
MCTNVHVHIISAPIIEGVKYDSSSCILTFVLPIIIHFLDMQDIHIIN